MERLDRIITKLSLQDPASHPGNAQRIEFLRNAVVGSEWASEPLSRMATQNLSYQQLHGGIEAAYRFSKETKKAVLGENV